MAKRDRRGRPYLGFVLPKEASIQIAELAKDMGISRASLGRMLVLEGLDQIGSI
jgi:hypothetical protein